MGQKLNLGGSPYSAPPFDDDEVYPVRWKCESTIDETPDFNELPSLEDAHYLFSTVKFHLGQIFRILDEKAFIAGLESFYHSRSSPGRPDQPRLWLLQYFLVLSFGRAFISQSKVLGEPPGWKYFARAMSLMPDYASLAKDVLKGIDVLVLTGLYLYSIDHRESAQVFVCQAIRMAQLEGLHTQLPEEALGIETVTRCRDLWWTLYVIDRHFSSSLGLPMTVKDEDTTTLLDGPGATLHSDPMLSLQVRLSRVHSFIVSTIYKSEKTPLGHFLESTRFVLHSLAGHAQEIEKIIHVNLHASVQAMSRGTRHITLLYHQCVIMATRPLLLSVLTELLEKLNQGREDWKSLLHLTKTLISTGIKSASKTIQIISEDDNISAFLIFNLEFLFGAAIHLTMANAIFPDFAESQPFHDRDAAHLLFDEMVNKGNKVAKARKAHLGHLELLFDELARKVQQQGLQPPALFGPCRDLRVETGGPDYENQQQASIPHIRPQQQEIQLRIERGLAIGDESASRTTVAGPSMMPSPIATAHTVSTFPDRLQSPGNIGFLDNIGISSDDFFNIVDQMVYPEFTNFDILDP
ncbi:putative Zn(II)2Cys6 transcription factor [Seiridium cardinale]